MVEILELIKVVGAPVAILSWLVWKLWVKNEKKSQKIYGMYERLIDEQKRDALMNMRMMQAHLSGKGDSIAKAYIEFLTKEADELKKEIDEAKK
ncbi:MAG: hypothetical protein WBB37_07510 [bacterium]